MSPKPKHHTSLLPPDIEAAVFFMEDQLMFCQREHGDVLKPLSLTTLRAALSSVALDSGWLPPGLVRCGENAQGAWAVLWIPPAVHRLTLTGATPRRNPNEHVRIEVPLPGLVLCGHGQRYLLFATEGAEFSPQARALHAPLSNVHPDGAICWGSNRVPDSKPSQMPAAWRLFMESPFNGDLSQGKSRSSPDDVRERLVELSRQRAAAYPIDDLEPYGRTTIAECLRSILKSGGQDDVEP